MSEDAGGRDGLSIRLEYGAFHEAGHAVVSVLEGLTFERVRLRPDGLGGLDFDAEPRDPEEAKRFAKRALGGYAVDTIRKMAPPPEASVPDLNDAYDLVSEALPPAMKAPAPEAGRVAVDLYNETVEDLERPAAWAAVKALAAALLEERCINYDRAKAIIDRAMESE